ncbi:toxin [Pseudomonas sp. GD03842]|uniref:SpvB/TcaC N-terminal domain-containing protein n=1 Tax=Pseudomonas sp. GD03842 TaxID=2975385 RepID=UPI002448D3F7|nr:SpvB/TcaC N-terminal domain-containing protein [Pseudomonas sp. GD03842]MDH0746399.1 toxin [Pseudomonas sp. GD03842]
MADQQEHVGISAPSLPKGGGAIQSIGKGFGAVGAMGVSSLSLPLPVSAGRGYAPQLALNYQSSVGNGIFGLGWGLNLEHVSRRTSKGVPRYTDDDVILGPGGDVWLAQRDAQGSVVETTVDTYGDLTLDKSYQVIRYFARVESAFNRIEHWRHVDDIPGFWLVHGADGSLAMYGRNPGSRIADPEDANRVAEWLLEETMNARGEHILYTYKPEDMAGTVGDTQPDPARDFTAQRYLHRVCYGNFAAHSHLYLWRPEQVAGLEWHFYLVADYGERVDQGSAPPFVTEGTWGARSDFHSSFATGFEVGTLRLAHQFILFHHFPAETGEMPQAVASLKFGYTDLAQRYQALTLATSWGWYHYDDGTAKVEGQSRPPLSFTYQDFDARDGSFTSFLQMPGLDDGQRYQLVDLYGEGMAGVLHRDDKGWMYRAPQRDVEAQDPDAVTYGAWQLLPLIPVADAQAPVRQMLADLTGNGRLDWVLAQPACAGFFSMKADGSWSNYLPFAAFPPEFFNAEGQLVDLVGDGLGDFALVGPRSVRLYASRRAEGFAAGENVPHEGEDDRLPVLRDSPNELVVFCDILGSGQQHLVRIRHDEIRFWPNLGRGKFGKGQPFATLPFSYTEFDAGRIRLADMDGSGAVDLIYLESEGFKLFLNRSGRGLSEPVFHAWPEGVRYDRLCQVSMADLQGLGCSSLVLTTPHLSPTHWRYDHPPVKPYLLRQTHNNMGASGTVTYRSSAQEWLDEKHELQMSGSPIEPGVPFALHVVSRQTQLDEVTGNQLTQIFHYRQGYYDGEEREFRGFGLVMQRDSEAQQAGQEDEGFTAPVLSKTWYHTGRFPHRPAAGFNQSDPQAQALGEDLLTTYDQGQDQVIQSPTEAQSRSMGRTLAGSVIRAEVFAMLGDRPDDVPYSVRTSRYLVRELEPAGLHQPYARMLPLMLESISYQYEGFADDPMCQRSISLGWDAYGVLTHGANVHYARRKRESDAPPFEDEHQQRWWRAAHDEAQQRFYLTESRVQVIHLDAPQSWRLGLPYLRRDNAMMAEAADVNLEDISYEAFIQADGWFASLPRTLLTLTRQRYKEAGEGEATFQALPDATEMAELDEHALTAYDRVMTADQLTAKLIELGYHTMACFLPEEPERVLWSVKREFNTYAGAEHFYRVDAFRPTASHGLSRVEYDPYSMQLTAVTAPDGCRTSATFSYYSLQPIKVVDPNQNTQEALYDGFGMLRMTSFHGTELGEAVGFDSLEHVVLPDQTPDEAISNPSQTINFGTAYFYDAYSWTDRKVPVHSLVQQWDRYPGDPERQLRMTLSSVDGFGRQLQTRQLVEPGMAYQVIDGHLCFDGDGLIEVDVKDKRWRVSERVEYNNKGLAIRVYRPYFTDSHGYVSDSSVRELWYHDKQFYDPLGRPTESWTAKGWLRRTTYRNWYSIAEDENDTAEEVNARRAQAGLPLLDDGSNVGRKKNVFGF